MTTEEKYEAVPIWKRTLLSLEEASAYTGINIIRLREMTLDPDCEYVLYAGKRRMIKRRRFDEYLDGLGHADITTELKQQQIAAFEAYLETGVKQQSNI